ncbi:16S rRNA (adenine1518-N6/adenine1519-N6)-dimethyltransferase [Ruminococcaceae bacterium YRB3002]|nr:16S rRNA (adenine1518-N6/adenine1519-N6)-dimethyltransferase [Ruminococcaceae bacterium YRB3002]
MNRNEIIRLTDEIGFLPEQKFGQNFLCDEASIERIIDLCDLREGDHVLEIGPGLGSLTGMLAKPGIELTAVEIDKRLAEFIGNEYGCRVIASDYTRLAAGDYDASSYDVAVSNIPYYLMTPIMKKLIIDLNNSRKLVLMVEKEALQRICAKPGTKQYGPLAVLCSLYGNMDVVFDLPGNYYYPVPKTTSTVITLTRQGGYNIDEGFIRFVEQCFSNRRKKVTNNADVSISALTGLGYKDTCRAEEISPEDFIKLYVV